MNSIPLELNDTDLFHFFESDPVYQSQIQDKQWLSSGFIRSYHQSLYYYKMFYHDLAEHGNLATADEILYFVPGFNGTPAQITFGLPGIMKQLGRNIYLRALYIPELSARIPTWVKYNADTLAQKRAEIVKDLKELTQYGKKVRVICSSSGFYDFLAAYGDLKEMESMLTLYWVSCAPDVVSPNKWEKVFYPLNGFKYEGHKWFSYPNLQILKKLNPECGERTYFRHGEQKNIYHKNELESRFFHKGILWDYISIDLFNFYLQENLRVYEKNQVSLDLDVHVLAGIKDGFWDDSSPAIIEQTLRKYFKPTRILYKESSHLWVVTPDHIDELLNHD